jgi:hypothetical protein
MTLTGSYSGLTLTTRTGRSRPLDFINQAFTPIAEDPMLDRRFSLTWDWGNATTGYSFHVSDSEDKELFLSFKAREGYMTLPELQAGHWMANQAQRFDALVARLYAQLGWNM